MLVQQIMLEEGKFWLEKKCKLLLNIFFCFILSSFSSDTKINEISKFLSDITSLSSEFVQIDSNGNSETGMIFMQKPGKLRVEYTQPNPNLIISDNRKLVHINKKIPYINVYKMSDIPIKMLVSEKFLMKDYKIIDYQNQNKIVEIELKEKENQKLESIRLIFEEKPLILKKWIVKDGTGTQTVIFLKNLSLNNKLNQKLFRIEDPSKVPLGKKVY